MTAPLLLEIMMLKNRWYYFLNSAEGMFGLIGLLFLLFGLTVLVFPQVLVALISIFFMSVGVLILNIAWSIYKTKKDRDDFLNRPFW